MAINDLKNKWDKEKNSYKKQEVGTGVHSFIRNFLESEDLFALKEGSLSTKHERRQKEYIHEKRAKEKRQADFVLYINQDIVIPLEAECYEKIELGREQLFNYQRDFDKQYGILTDGYIWRFYNNNIYRGFNLDQIFEETDIFLEFWKEYTKPEFYYLSLFEPQGQPSLLKDVDILPVEQNRQIFFDDITKLIKSFKNKLQIEGYFNGLDKKEKERKAVEITYAYIIQFILYKTLVDNDFGKFGEEFENKVKKIHEYIKNKRYKDILGVIDGISAEISKNIYRPFKKEQEFICQKLLKLYQSAENKLSDVSPWLDIFVFIKKYNFVNVENEIFGYIYENYLKELYEDEKKGQYFTDPAVVNFMLQQIGWTPEKILKRYSFDKNNISLIDPACGSGTFLYSAVNVINNAFENNSEEKSKLAEEVVINNIFGLDIAEFPLYLAEMNILMRMLPLIIGEKYNNPVDKKIKIFLTKDSIAEFTNTNIKNTLNDLDVEYQKSNGQLQLFQEAVSLSYQSFVREEIDIEEMKQSLENHKLIRRRFDFVIGNPPYVSYNECSEQGVLFFDLMKKKEAKLNDVYGINLHSIPNKPKKYRPNPNLYAFFTALGIALLKDNGKLCYIIPQTILTAGDLGVLRYHLAKFTTIEKIILFSGKMFIGRGIKQNKPVATSSLIFVVRREVPGKLHKVEIIRYKNPDDEIEKCLQNILNGKKINKKNILQNKLLQNVVNWNFIKQDKAFLDFYEEYRRTTDDISIYYNHASAGQKFKSKFWFDSGYSIDEKRLLLKVPEEEYYIYPKLNSNFWQIKKYRGFWPNIRGGKSPLAIKLRQANQGYNLLDSPHKIIWSYANPNKFHFTSLPIIWARNQICAIGSENKEELLYLFSLLNSPVVNMVLNANLRSEQEKDYLVSTSAIKEFVRIPKILEHNYYIKDEIIKHSEEVLNLEEKALSDFVNFSKVMIQKFDEISLEDNNLILKKDNKDIKLSISENKKLVKKVLEEKYCKQGLTLEKQKISLSELKTLPVIDFERQGELKDYIDDLVFVLYFNIYIDRNYLGNPKKVKDICSKNKFYKLIENTI